MKIRLNPEWREEMYVGNLVVGPLFLAAIICILIWLFWTLLFMQPGEPFPLDEGRVVLWVVAAGCLIWNLASILFGPPRLADKRLHDLAQAQRRACREAMTEEEKQAREHYRAHRRTRHDPTYPNTSADRRRH